jgi:hypothetical protein
VQSAVRRSSGPPGASTAYLTGTLTDVIRSLVRGPRRSPAVSGGLMRLAALLAR